ncbi:MAG: NurA domain-containing protein, partial [Bacteroidota bacterium]
VATLPVKDKKVVLAPTKDKFKHLNLILSNLSKLKCDMYENALVPIALINQLVSIANRPSSVLLEKFAKKEIKR